MSSFFSSVTFIINQWLLTWLINFLRANQKTFENGGWHKFPVENSTHTLLITCNLFPIGWGTLSCCSYAEGNAARRWHNGREIYIIRTLWPRKTVFEYFNATSIRNHYISWRDSSEIEILICTYTCWAPRFEYMTFVVLGLISWSERQISVA